MTPPECMTAKQRMITAYRGDLPDTVPVAPEFWYYIPARILGIDMITFEREVPFWQALQRTFRHYDCEGWGAVFASVPVPDVKHHETWTDLGDGKFESRHTMETPFGALTSSQHYDRMEPSWAGERQIKDFDRDWPAYKHATIGGIPEETDWQSVKNALQEVGDDYLLELWLGVPFFDYVATGRKGGLEQGVFDLIEHESFFEALQKEYIEYIRRLARAAATGSDAEAFTIGCAWSCVSVIGPDLWRRWDKPVIQAVAEELHAAGKLLHIHFHGKSHVVLQDLADCGADCVCPFERPPGGDISDLSEVRRIMGDRTTVNGNVHTVETLIRGSVQDVEREVHEIFEQWGADKRRLILGTGDQVGKETPDENIYAMIKTGRRLGRVSSTQSQCLETQHRSVPSADARVSGRRTTGDSSVRA